MDKKFEYFHEVVRGYVEAQDRACAAFDNCRVVNTLRVDENPHLVSPDGNHLDLAGQRANAELVGPIVTELMELRK